MGDWEKKSLKLRADHLWRSKPGYKIFVADRGAVRFDFPRDWLVEPGTDSIRFFDRKPPKDDCRIELSVFHLNREIDWAELKIAELLRQIIEKPREGVVFQGEVVTSDRPGIEMAWAESHSPDSENGRLIWTRTLLARGNYVQPLITFMFYADLVRRFEPVWAELLRSLRLGQKIDDPTLGSAGRG